VIDYGRFRAASEQHGYNWKEWPQRMMEGSWSTETIPSQWPNYYMYTQWLAQEQIEAVCKKARQAGVYLYLDLPVGVHPHSYDVWRERESFVMGVNGGAPPDPVFTSGQKLVLSTPAS
jgi:4-alpha-glucanotransferase